METIPEEETTSEIQILTSEIVEAQDRAAIDIQISTAKQYPRNVVRSADNAVAIVSMDLETAQSCHYSVPRGGKQISGPSVHLAKVAAQCWGNMRIEAKVVAQDEYSITSEAVAFDLESNLAAKVQVKRSIRSSKGKFSNDMIIVTGNAANSIALRNAIYNVIPRGVINRIYNAAKEKITGKISDANALTVRVKQVMDGLKGSYEVTEAEILKAIGKQSIKHITADDIVTMIGIGTAIRDGDTTVEEAFKGKKVGSTENIAKDIIDDEKPAAEPEPVPSTLPQFTDSLKKKIMEIQKPDPFIKYVNQLTHMHGIPEFQEVVKQKCKDLEFSSNPFTWLK